MIWYAVAFAAGAFYNLVVIFVWSLCKVASRKPPTPLDKDLMGDTGDD